MCRRNGVTIHHQAGREKARHSLAPARVGRFICKPVSPRPCEASAFARRPGLRLPALAFPTLHA